MLRNARSSPTELAHRQQALLGDLVRRAARAVPFYREAFAAAGVDAGLFDPTRDLARLPIVTKAMLRAAGPASMVDVPPSALVTISTSGSSGEPFQFQIDRHYDQWRKAQFLRAYLAGGRRLRDRMLRISVHNAAPTPLFSRLGLLQEQRVACSMPAEEMVATWKASGAQILLGYPSTLRDLAMYCQHRGRPLDPAPRVVFSDSELLTAPIRTLLEEHLNAPVLDVFGTFETDNIAFQCARRTGFHIATDNVVIEIVRDGVPVAMGETGEIVVTVLRNHTSPFIRYNLRDLGSLSPEPCSCGLPFPLLTNLQGRSDDMVLMPDGSESNAARFIAKIQPLSHNLRQFQIRQLTVDQFELVIEPAASFKQSETQTLLHALRTALPDITAQIRVVDRLEFEKSGKRRTFVRLAQRMPQHA